MKYLIIGSGRMAMGAVNDLLNLNSTSEIHISDQADQALNEMKNKFNDDRLILHKADAKNREQMISLMNKVDGILGAASYEYNYDLTQWAIETGCHFVDLGGNYLVVERQFKLNQKAREAGVGVIPDCGLAPGMVSVVAAHAIKQLDEVEDLSIRVGGLPVEPKTPLKYMLIFSVKGLINEYIEDAIILQNGAIKSTESMTGIESLEFPAPYGSLEAFYTSGGTSTLPYTYEGKIMNLDYKTIRYPGHCHLFKAMIDLGFVEPTKMIIQKQQISRREIFERLLEETLSLEGEDVALIRVSAKGKKEGMPITYVYQAIEYGDKKNNLTAMMRTTAYPAIIALEMLVEGRIKDRGVLRQEISIPPDLFLDELEKRNIKFEINEKEI